MLKKFREQYVFHNPYLLNENKKSVYLKTQKLFEAPKTLGDDEEIVDDSYEIVQKTVKMATFLVMLPKIKSSLNKERKLLMKKLGFEKNKATVEGKDQTETNLNKELEKIVKAKDKLKGQYDEDSKKKREDLDLKRQELNDKIEQAKSQAKELASDNIEAQKEKFDLKIEETEKSLEGQKENTDKMKVLPMTKFGKWSKGTEFDLAVNYISRVRDEHELEYNSKLKEFEVGQRLKEIKRKILELEQRIKKNGESATELVKNAKAEYSQDELKQAQKNISKDLEENSTDKSVSKDKESKSDLDLDKLTSKSEIPKNKKSKVGASSDSLTNKSVSKDSPDITLKKKAIADSKKTIKKLKKNLADLDNYSGNADMWKDMITKNIDAEKEKVKKNQVALQEILKYAQKKKTKKTTFFKNILKS